MNALDGATYYTLFEFIEAVQYALTTASPGLNWEFWGRLDARHTSPALHYSAGRKYKNKESLLYLPFYLLKSCQGYIQDAVVLPVARVKDLVLGKGMVAMVFESPSTCQRWYQVGTA